MLHDIGWKMVPEEKQRNAFGPQATDKAANRLHEVEGVRIAGEILAGLEYDSAKTEEILTIIDGHDSRLEALSLNDNLVKDADKLWRFTPTGVGIDYRRFGGGGRLVSGIPQPENRGVVFYAGSQRDGKSGFGPNEREDWRLRQWGRLKIGYLPTFHPSNLNIQ
ncbi:MAG: HD domain-containing protein [Anaerolineae bacterium]